MAMAAGESLDTAETEGPAERTTACSTFRPALTWSPAETAVAAEAVGSWVTAAGVGEGGSVFTQRGRAVAGSGGDGGDGAVGGNGGSGGLAFVTPESASQLCGC